MGRSFRFAELEVQPAAVQVIGDIPPLFERKFKVAELQHEIGETKQRKLYERLEAMEVCSAHAVASGNSTLTQLPTRRFPDFTQALVAEQRLELDAASLEPQFHDLRDAHGAKVTTLYSNKGL